MRFREIIQGIKDLDLYSVEQWEEYLGYFKDSKDLGRYLSERLHETKGWIQRRIESSRGSGPIAPDYSISKKITRPDVLGKLKNREGITLGIVSGAFDVLHLGHIRSMTHAKQFVNNYPNPLLCAMILSDENIRIKKGENRPILNLNERLDMLSHVACVDHIIPLEESNCLTALNKLKPDYFFKAGRDRAQGIVLQEIELVESNGGSVIIPPPGLNGGKSATGIIETILSRIDN